MRTPTVLLATIFGVLAFSTAPALAAAPEAPETTPPTEVTTNTAVFHGLLNPHAPGKELVEEWLFFWGEPGSTTCQNYGIAPLEVGHAGTLTPEPEETPFPGLEENTLEPNSSYTYCLAARSGESEEWTYGNPVTFKTLPAPPTIISVSAPAKASEARLEAVVNPSNEPTQCRFEYGSGSVTEHEAPCEQASISGGSEQTVSAAATGLTAGTGYQYEVIAENATSREEGKPSTKQGSFTTPRPPETPETKPATGITVTTATLNGVLNPNGEGEPGSYEFLYRASASECEIEKEGVREPVKATPPQPSTAVSPQPVGPEEVTGLLANTTYTYCLRAINSAGETTLGNPESFTTATAAVNVGEESFDHVGSSSATLQGKLNPGGAPTSYFFEYATDAEYTATKSYASKTPVQNAGAASEPVSVLAPIENLTPDVTYHFRLVAAHANETAAEGVDTEFSTFPAGPLGLPDGRQFEIVSPLDNGDATVLTGSPVRAAANGDGLAYIGTASPEGGTGEINIQAGRPQGDNVYLAKRSTGGGWNASDIQPVGLNKAFYRGFSSDLAVGIIGSEQALLPGAPNGEGDDGLYTRENSSGNYDLLGAGANYAGSTPDGIHVLFNDAEGLYDAFKGAEQPYLVSTLPDGEPDPNATFGSTTRDLEHIISNDGSRIFWTDTSTGNLYARENDTQPNSPVEGGRCVVPTDACTVLIAAAGTYMTAASDGSKVFFTDEANLASNSTAAPGAPDLYECTLDSNGPRISSSTSSGCSQIIDLTPDPNTGPHGEQLHANVAGVLGTNTTGSYIYFAAAGDLTNTTTPQKQECSPPTEGEGPGNRCNIYVVHEDKAPKLIATVATGDGEGGVSHKAEVITSVSLSSEFGDWVPVIGNRSAFVSNSGNSLVFESVEDLTRFHAGGGREIYEYDVNNGVSCVSCNPSGASTTNGPFFEFAHSELSPSLNSTYQTRDISADGSRVFFESNEPLVSQLTNEEGKIPYPGRTVTRGLTNVFEWERDGTGSCLRAQGCIYLLSTGTSPDISFFIDASENGNDVFLGTRADLVPQDHGEVYEVYDAHQCSEAVPCPHETATACTGTGCQGVPAAPPIFATPSSVTFNGIGNFPAPKPAVVKKKTAAQLKAEKLSKALKACHADKRAKKRKACEAAARRKYGPSKKAVTKETR